MQVGISQATWLLNLDAAAGAPDFAVLLDFFAASAGKRSSAFASGEQLAAGLVFYPARLPLRAVLAERRPLGSARPWPGHPPADPLAGYLAPPECRPLDPQRAGDAAAGPAGRPRLLPPSLPEALRGAIDKSRRSFRPRFGGIDWPRAIRANLRHDQAEHRTIVPERLVGFRRRQRRIVDLDEVVLCVDQSGSMATSVIYASIFSAVMASLPVVRTRLVCFDTAVFDLTDQLADPVEVLFGVRLGGGTDINQAVAYCEAKIERPSKSHLILITDLCEGGNADELVARRARLIGMGVNLIVLLALTDTGRPSDQAGRAGEFAALGAPVFACTPDQFPDLMATALRREDVHARAAKSDIKTVREDDQEGA